MKRQVPRGVPRVFPFVGHREDVTIEHVGPIRVAARLARLRRRRNVGIAREPVLHDIMVKLFVPEQAGVGSSRDKTLLRTGVGRDDFAVVLVGFLLALSDHAAEALSKELLGRFRLGKQAERNFDLAAGGNLQTITRRHLGAEQPRIDSRPVTVDEITMEGILDVARRVCHAVESLGVGHVVGKKPIVGRAVGRRVGRESKTAQRDVLGQKRIVVAQLDQRLDPTSLVSAAPGPRIAIPERGEQMQRRVVGPPVDDRDRDQHVVGRRFRVLDEHVEVTILGENARVGQLKLGLLSRTPPVLLEQRLVGKPSLGILVQRLHIRMGGRRIEMVVALLNVLAVVALEVGQSEEPLLEDRIAAVPKGRSRNTADTRDR